MRIIINQPRASYFIGGSEMISFNHAANFLKLNNEITYITINPKSVGLKYTKQYQRFFNEYKEKIHFIEIDQDSKIQSIYNINPGESRCRWNIESIFYNKIMFNYILNDNKSYDYMLSYYNLDAVFVPQSLIKNNVLYLCGFPDREDDFQGSFLSVYDKVIAISKETKDYWQRYRNDSINIITTGVDCNKFSPKKSSGRGQKINVLFIGRLIARKNVDKIILAVEELKNKYEINLTIVGDGPERNYLKSLSNNAKFVGISENPEKFYRASDIFITPSEFGEGVQGTILEAMSCGLKIVATNTIINKQLLGNNRGVLINPTIDDISHGIEEAIKLNKKDIASKTRSFVIENFDWLKKTKELQKEMEK